MVLCFYLQQDASIPISAKMKSIQLLQMCYRSVEEQHQIKLDIACTAENFTEQHTLLDSTIRSTTNVSHRALFYKKVLKLEELIHEFWNVLAKYVDNLPRMPDSVLPGTLFDLSDTETATDDESYEDIDSDCSDSDSDEDTEHS